MGGTVEAVHAETVRDEVLGVVRGRARASGSRCGRAPVVGGRPSRSWSRWPPPSGEDGWQR